MFLCFQCFRSLSGILYFGRLDFYLSFVFLLFFSSFHPFSTLSSFLLQTFPILLLSPHSSQVHGEVCLISGVYQCTCLPASTSCETVVRCQAPASLGISRACVLFSLPLAGSQLYNTALCVGLCVILGLRNKSTTKGSSGKAPASSEISFIVSYAVL